MKPFLFILCTGLIACDDVIPSFEDEGPFAAEVISFEPGPGAGFGQDALPDIVLGPPQGGFTSQGSTDVVSLGAGGKITLRLGRTVQNEDGPDLLIFENPFEVPGQGIFAEPAEISVSTDGLVFTPFPCAAENEAPNGCAGYSVVLAGPGNDLDATDPAAAGGDAFDLDAIDIEEAQFVRIIDRGTSNAGTSAGFDLDAVAVVAH